MAFDLLILSDELQIPTRGPGIVKSDSSVKARPVDLDFHKGFYKEKYLIYESFLQV